MNSLNERMEFEPEIFKKTDIYKGYSEFCKQVIEILNDEIAKIAKAKHSIVTRNGTDNKITFTIYLPSKRNLITLYPNKKLKHVKIEIRDKHNRPNPFNKVVYSLDDIGEIISRVKSLTNNLYEDK